MRDTASDLIRHRKLIETTSKHSVQVLSAGTVSTNMFLRRLHNHTTGTRWLPWLVLPKRLWPAVHHKERRAINGAAPFTHNWRLNGSNILTSFCTGSA
jgi:hypothetical protein